MTTKEIPLRERFETFFGATSDEVDAVLAHVHRVELEGGQWLFRQGEPGDSIYFLVRGRLEIWISPEAGAEARRVGEILPGRSVGEIGMLTGSNRSASVRAIRDSLLFGVNRAQFEALGRVHPTIVMKLAGRIASLLRDRTAASMRSGHKFGTISIAPLGRSARVEAFCRRLPELLGAHGSTLAMDRQTLGSSGAPVESLPPSEPPPDTLREWLHDQETSHRFLVYQCEPTLTSWSVYAVQQSDVVVYVADSAHLPRRDDEEIDFNDAVGASNAKRVLVVLHGEGQEISGTSAWLEDRAIDYHFHVRADALDDSARVARVLAGRAVGLVLAAGAARGFAHLGVYRAMKEAGIPVDWVGGTSIGAAMGASIARDWPAADIIDLGREAFGRNNPFGDYTLPLFSLLAGKRLEQMLHRYMPGRIEDLPLPFYAVSCNLDTGLVNLHERGNLAEALRASTSMPGIMPPAVVDRHLAIDGAVLNSMPVDLMQQKPVGRVIAVDLSAQKQREVDYQRLPSPWRVMAGRVFPFLGRHKVPSLMTLMLKATEVGTVARVREAGRGADLLLEPPVREFGMMALADYDRIVEAGYHYALPVLEEWKRSDDSTS